MQIYYRNRQEAGQILASQLTQPLKAKPTVVSLTVSSLLVALEVAKKFTCPLQLYVTEEVMVPGNLAVGGMNQDGGFAYSSDISEGFIDYFYRELRGYIEDSQRIAYSHINAEVGNATVIRHDLIRGHTVFLVADCLSSNVQVDSFISYARRIGYKDLIVCAPVIVSELLSHIEETTDSHFIGGAVDYFYGVEHYFEDNKTVPFDHAIRAISEALTHWPLEQETTS